MSNSTDAKLVALQLLGVAERAGVTYIETMGAWGIKGDESKRLIELRTHFHAHCVYRLAEEALTDLEILLPEYPIVDPPELTAEEIQAESQKLHSAIEGLSLEEAGKKILELATQSTTDLMSRPHGTKHWEKMLENRRALVEDMPKWPPARVETAAKKLQMALAISERPAQPTRLITEEQSVAPLRALAQRRKLLQDKQEWVGLRIAALTNNDSDNPSLLKGVRYNQSANVFLEQYLRSLVNLNHHTSELREGLGALLDREIANNDQLSDKLHESSEANGINSEETTDLFIDFLTAVTGGITRDTELSSLTTFVEAATLDLSIAELLIAEAEVALK